MALRISINKTTQKKKNVIRFIVSDRKWRFSILNGGILFVGFFMKRCLTAISNENDEIFFFLCVCKFANSYCLYKIFYLDDRIQNLQLYLLGFSFVCMIYIGFVDFWLVDLHLL